MKVVFVCLLATQLADLVSTQTDSNIDCRSTCFANNITTSYVIWGKMTCPSHADTVYSGYVGGGYFSHKGGAAEPLCLPRDPEWGLHTDGLDDYRSHLYGAEYQVSPLTNSRKSLRNHDVPCAVCEVSKRTSTMMIPARKNCYGGWYKEYQGYLMAGYYNHDRASKYICIDEFPDTLPGGQFMKGGYLLYSVEVRCGSLPCPPYVEGRELTCVVCSQ